MYYDAHIKRLYLQHETENNSPASPERQEFDVKPRF